MSTERVSCDTAASSPIATTTSPGMSGALVKPGSRTNLEASSFDAASASQVRLKDAYLGGLKKEQQGNLTHENEQISEEIDDCENEPWYYRPAPQKNNEDCGKTLAGGSAEFVSSEFQKSQSNKGAASEHFLAISPHHVPYVNNVYDMVRKVYARPADDSLKYLYVKMAFW